MYKLKADRIQVGISSCLLGDPVRYNGGHKRSQFCSETLSRHMDLVPFCPEMAIGLGTPRPSIHLLKQGSEIIARTSDGKNVGEPLAAYGARVARDIGALSGYIFCAKSPSCGVWRVPVKGVEGRGAGKIGTGVYAEQIIKAHPLLPVEEDGRLNDPLLRENFIMRVYAWHDWQINVQCGLSAGKLIDFHSRYKYMLLAHNPGAYRSLGVLLSELSSDLEDKARTYIQQFMEALQRPATRRNNTNVLQHMQGHLKAALTSSQRQELARVINAYREQRLPLLAPITLIRHHLSEHPSPYLSRQRYLDPHPEAMSLRYAI